MPPIRQMGSYCPPLYIKVLGGYTVVMLLFAKVPDIEHLRNTKSLSGMQRKQCICKVVPLLLYYEQNRSTAGCSKFKVLKHDKFKRDWFQH